MEFRLTLKQKIENKIYDQKNWINDLCVYNTNPTLDFLMFAKRNTIKKYSDNEINAIKDELKYLLGLVHRHVMVVNKLEAILNKIS